MTVVSAVSEKPKGALPPVGCHDSSLTSTPTPDVAFLCGTQHSSLTTEVEDTTAFLKEAERTARNEVQVWRHSFDNLKLSTAGQEDSS